MLVRAEPPPRKEQQNRMEYKETGKGELQRIDEARWWVEDVESYAILCA